MTLLSRLVIQHHISSSLNSELCRQLMNLGRDEFDSLVSLASTNHVIVRGFEVFVRIAQQEGNNPRLEWAQEALRVEQARIANAISFLEEICAAFDEEKCDVTVIKSLDHWPDLGSDLDLYTNATSDNVISLM